jgi:DNA mismatch repair ATPase MutS
VLDHAALQALSLFPDAADDDDNGVAFSLFQLLDRTRTAGGSRLLHTWIRQPLADRDDIGLLAESVMRYCRCMQMRADALTFDCLCVRCGCGVGVGV